MTVLTRAVAGRPLTANELDDNFNTLTFKTGTVEIDFGTSPGTNYITSIITGQTSILTTSIVKAWITGSTTMHNEIEHIIIPFRVTITNIINSTGFTINVFSDYRLTGTFRVQYEWY